MPRLCILLSACFTPLWRLTGAFTHKRTPPTALAKSETRQNSESVRSRYPRRFASVNRKEERRSMATPSLTYWPSITSTMDINQSSSSSVFRYGPQIFPFT